MNRLEQCDDSGSGVSTGYPSSDTPETTQYISAVSAELQASGKYPNETIMYLRTVKLARRLEKERNEARNQLYRIITEGFGADDTITGETCAEYVLRRLGKIQENAIVEARGK